MNLLIMVIALGSALASCTASTTLTTCEIPDILQGSWYSWENERNQFTNIEGNKFSKHGECVLMAKDNANDYTFIVKQKTKDCYACIRVLVRTPNVFESALIPDCITLPTDVEPTLENVCSGIAVDQQSLITHYNTEPKDVDCRASIAGRWKFSYKNPEKFTGVCNHTESEIRSCSTSETTNGPVPRFDVTYTMCYDNSDYTWTATAGYKCLGDWFVGSKHYFAVYNYRESRKNEKYRCFLWHLGDNVHLGNTLTPACNTLKSPEEAPESFTLTADGQC